jgi:hypothetical protein
MTRLTFACLIALAVFVGAATAAKADGCYYLNIWMDGKLKLCTVCEWAGVRNVTCS